MSTLLYIAARAPRPGFTKTRLGQAIGDEQATLLYTAFLRDLAARLARAPFTVGWYVTPDDAWDDIAPLVHGSAHHEAPTPWPGPILVQGPGDWAKRQQDFFREAPTRGETKTILIASDSPHLDVGVIVEAFALLDSCDIVLGPTIDGGYYLIGMRGPWEVLGGVPMSTSTVLIEIVERADRLGLSTAFLEQTFDVDGADDLQRLAQVVAGRDDLPATRAALAVLGTVIADGRAALPRTVTGTATVIGPMRPAGCHHHVNEGAAS